MVELTPDSQGVQLTFVLADIAGLLDGNRYALPTEADAILTSDTGQYTACQGELRVTHYLPGQELWGTWTLAAGPGGVCGPSDSYTSLGDFINVFIYVLQLLGGDRR